ncbi:MAG: hypothetical protein IJB90_02225 [Clostridia bacterium]|nr:hypothetical protein [Clostridia bacterium]MBQ3145380.1 hypothetical protein [Clostridia bacterium]
MGTLYTCVSEAGKKDIIILNAKYSRGELADKLRSTESSHRVCPILDEGRQLQKELKIRCRAEGRITTEEEGLMYYFYKGDKVILYPDGAFQIKPSIFRRIFG